LLIGCYLFRSFPILWFWLTDDDSILIREFRSGHTIEESLPSPNTQTQTRNNLSWSFQVRHDCMLLAFFLLLGEKGVP